MLIELQQPFNFIRTLKFILSPPSTLNGRPHEPLMDHYEDGEYRRAIWIDGRPVLYGVAEEPHSTPPSLRVRLLKGPSGRRVYGQIQQVVSRQFGARLDLAPFHSLASNDKVLSRLVHHFQGMRIPQAPSVYECVICAILEQQ
ncbi:MAG TPA: hypothetical protein VGW37_12960, partial [Terriglobia bacterium]|nr:hypothetical protein [Terriglobia bacterium]